MKLRLEKGTYRYRTAHKKRQLFFVVLFILAIVAQLVLRNFITEQIYKNLVTISAILTVLPMANLASPLVVPRGSGGSGGISQRMCSIRGEISDLIRSDHYIE